MREENGRNKGALIWKQETVAWPPASLETLVKCTFPLLLSFLIYQTRAWSYTEDCELCPEKPPQGQV